MSMAQSSYYSYSPLDGHDTIRLLMIEAADDKIPREIKCRLEHFSISKAPSYTALSYAWGDGSHKSRIHLDGQVCEVGQNLFQALWHLRGYGVGQLSNKVSSKREKAWIWIDALCIDQRNILERNHQVRLMGRIYETAVQVIIWLGWTGSESDKKSQGAMSYLMHMRKETTENMLQGGIELNERDEYVAIRLGRQKAMFLRRQQAMDIARHLYRCDLSKFVELCNLPYWYRMWIVQEMGLAKKITILLGRRAVPWSCLGFLRRFLDYKEFTTSLPLTKRQSYASSCEKIRTSQAFRLVDLKASRKRKNLAALIEACEDSLCSDPRDKVYALLGLATDPEKDELPIDYSKTLFEVYADTVIFQYRIYKGQQGDPSQKIVRFSQILQRSFNRFAELGDTVDSYSSQRCEVQDRKDLMHIFGVCAGTVTDLCNSTKATAALVDKARDVPQFNSPIPPEIPQVLEVMKKVTSISSNVSFALKAKEAAEQSIATNIANDNQKPQNSDLLSKEQDVKYLVFKLDNHRTGYAPTNAQAGDIICQFVGCDVAALLRPRQGGYNIIGRAFVNKSAVELERIDEALAKKYLFSVPDHGANFSWMLEHTIHLCLDIVCLSQLTA